MSTNKTFEEKQIGEIVTDDFRAAEIFKNAGIDFCCGGKKSLGEACKESGANPDFLISELEEMSNTPAGNTHNFKDWDLGFMADYIINTHHKFVLKNLPELVFYTQKIAKVHGSHHNELLEVAELFTEINKELLQHLQKEEDVLFPAIKKAQKENDDSSREIIKSEILRMSKEHEFAGGAMDKIRILTANYKVPEDACNTYSVSLKLLEQFEDDLHVHVHLENNILYPKALLI